MNHTNLSLMLRASCALSVLALAACKPTPSSSDGGPTGPSYYTCTVDEALLNRGGDCLWDDACPCGSHCAVGACRFDCRADADCGAGKACDGFGRCVKAVITDEQGAVTTFAKGTSVAPPISGAPTGFVSLSGVPVELRGVDTVGQATLAVSDGGFAGALVQAAAGLEVQCAAGGAFDSSCNVPALDGGASLPLAVRVVDATKAGSYDVQVTTPAQALSFRVHYATDAALPPAPMEGVYTGFARLTALGSSARSKTSAIPSALSDLAVPVTMTVYAETSGARRVELSDDFGVIFPASKTPADLLRDSSNNFLLRQTSRAYVQVAAQDVDVAMAAVSTSFEKAAGGLSLTLRTRYLGVVDDLSAPFVQWQVSLARVGDLPANAVPPALPSAYTPGAVATRAVQARAFEASVLADAKGTALSGNSLKAQAVLCTTPGATAPAAFGPGISAPSWTGDLSCTGGTATAPVEQQAFGIIKDTVWEIGPTVARCMTDLRGGPVVGAGAGCINQGRALTAMAIALDADRQLALGNSTTADAPASAIAHRVTQQWLRTHLFVARQAAQIDLLNDVLTTEAQVARPFMQSEMLSLTGQGFDALLQPRIALGLSRLNPAVVFAPDYRAIFAPAAITVPNPRHEQPDGLPVTLVDTLHDDLGVYATLYERARFVPADRASLETSAQAFLRKSLVLAALATAMSDNAHANNTTLPTWEAKWTRALGLYGTAFAGLLRSIDNLRSGRNPLDIDDKLDLPLYRVGDQVGALNRFSAVSDYLLGTGTTLDNAAIVPSRILDAQAALDAARAATVANLAQDFAASQEDLARAGRLEALRRKYGEQVQSLCGDPALDANSVLLQDVDPDACFVKAACRLTRRDRIARMAPGDVARTLCMASLASQELGSGVVPGADAAVVAALVPLLERRVVVSSQSLDVVQGVVGIQTSASTLILPASLFFISGPGAAASLPADRAEHLRVTCEALASFSEQQRPTEAPSSCRNNLDCPSSTYCDVSHQCQPSDDVGERTACYQGSLGELVLSIRAARKDVDIARSEMDELSRNFELQSKKCAAEQTTGEQQVAALAAYNDAMVALGDTKLAFDVVTNVSDGVAACADTAASDTKFGTATVVACGARAISVVSKSVSDGMQLAMDQATLKQSLLSKQLEVDGQKASCAVEVEMTTVGMKTAALRVERALQEMTSQYLQLENQKNVVRVAMRDGREALQAETDRVVPGVAMDFWLSDKVELYGSAFRTARRSTYLGVLAVEYEYQISTIERQNVLAATKVAELKSVLDRLRNLVAAGSVHGHAPANLHAVVSVRTNLLQLADQSNLPAGWHALTDEQRFQLLLTSPRFAVYDRGGQYLGQELPFSVAPLAALKLGNASGVPLLSSTDCAERVWSVNATLQGTDLMSGDGTRPRVSLKKRNRFFSQWCTPAPNDSPFQLAATRPSRNLFLDPFTDYLPGRPGSAPSPSETVTAAAEADAFVAARLQPQLNVPRADFELDAFFNGSSTELAGRGLYGDYSLFFPAESLALGGAGLKLEHLDDVLLRFDYVSVAQQ